MSTDTKIAIVGMSTVVPGAGNYAEYWNNTLNSDCFIKEITEDYWRIEDYYDPDPFAKDKVYATHAGMVDSILFDAREFGISPKVMQSTSVDQLYSLYAAKQALIDARLYGENAIKYDKNRVGVAVAAAVAKTAFMLSLRSKAPLIGHIARSHDISDEKVAQIEQTLEDITIEGDEATNPGYLPSLCAGRIANRFGFGGTNCSVDAACASGLMVIKMAIYELLSGSCDIMLAGGLSMDLSETTFISFCKTPTLSATNKIKPFDANHDGMILGDGIGMVVLKKLSRAIKDNDRIYAVIDGLGTSSDGKANGIYSPNKDGQIRAMQQAYSFSSIKPKDISMVECHGTGTQIGDMCEISSLKEIFGEKDKEAFDGKKIVIGSSKGQIGHTRLAAGVMGLIRASLTLYHKHHVPSVGCETLHPDLVDSKFTVLKDIRPWIVNKNKPKRCAGVSAFGFGGSNCHMLLEEASVENSEDYRLSNTPIAIVLAGDSKEELITQLDDLIKKSTDEDFNPYDYSYRNIDKNKQRVGFVVKEKSEIANASRKAIKVLNDNHADYIAKSGVIYRKSLFNEGKICTLFSGQGSQKVGMLNKLTCTYKELREAFTLADNTLIDAKYDPVSDFVYPRERFAEQVNAVGQNLKNTIYAQTSLAAVESGLFDIMSLRGFKSDKMLGHSFGELVALYASKSIDKETLMQLSFARGQAMHNVSSKEDTGMIVLFDSASNVEKLISSFDNLWIANYNAQDQIVVSGLLSEIEQLKDKAKKEDINFSVLNVASAFHTEYMNSSAKEFEKQLKSFDKDKIHVNNNIVLSNFNNMYYNNKNFATNLVSQIENPIKFTDNIQKLYNSGIRIFLEVGPSNALINMAKNILKDKSDCIFIPLNIENDETSLEAFEQAMMHLFVLGFDIKADPYAKTNFDAFKVKKNKFTYTVEPTFFYLSEFGDRWEKIKSHIFSKMKTNTTNNSNFETNEINNEDGEDEEMKNLGVLKVLQSKNAEILETYMNTQKEQMENLKQALDKSTNMDEKSLLINFYSSFQNSSLNALKAFYNAQNAGLMLGGELSGNNTLFEEPEYVSDQPVISPNTAQSTTVIEHKAAEPVTVAATVQKPAPAAPAAPTISKEECKESIIQIIANATGYPDDMIEEDMDLNEDLGVDSIKMIDILSQVNSAYGDIWGEENFGELSTIRTVADCIEALYEKLSSRS